MEHQGQESSKMEPINYAAEHHCVLCRNKVQFYCNEYEYDISNDIANLENWETAVLALGFVNPEISGNADIAPHVFCFEAHIVFLETVYDAKPNLRVCIKPCGNLRTVGPLFFVHLACWELAQMHELKPSYDDLYNLGLQLSETMPRDYFKAPNPWHLASFASGNTLADSKWKSLLMKCAQLPREIQSRILSYASADTDKTAFSLLKVLTNCSLGLTSPSVVVPHTDNISLLVDKFNTKAVHLCASFVNIFGVDYLCHIEALNAPVRCDALNRRCACIEINAHRIRNIEFILGPIGILALRFHSTDGSKSSWLGSAARGWRCGPIDIIPQDINLLKNGHKNVLTALVSFYNRQFGGDRYSDELPLRLLWDVTRDLPDSGEAFTGEAYEARKPYPKALNCLPTQAMYSYLPLQENGVPVKGITVYACDEGTNSVIVHTKSSDVEVSAPGRRGTPTSFYFHKDEEIVTVGLVVIEDCIKPLGPYLTFKTNQQRLAFFGPPLMLFGEDVRYVSLIPDHLKEGCAVAGLIVNTLLKAENKLTMFGSHCESKQNPGISEAITSLTEEQVSYPAIPKIVMESWWPDQVKVTRAKLTKIKQLRVQKWLTMPENDMHHAGLLIQHTDGSIETLGCWDGSLTAPSELIYDAETDGELHRLVFHLRFRNYLPNGDEASYYVSNIVAHVDRPRKQPVAEKRRYMVNEEEFNLGETELEEMENEEMENEEVEEVVYPAEKTFDWDMNSQQPFITWCFNKKLDHIGDCSTETLYVELQERDGQLGKVG